jgi:hypothetical protein
MSEPDDLSVRPGEQSGWTMPLYGDDRCKNYGHELDFRCEYANGMLVGYCTRCSARIEMPWFRGGTISALARFMTDEASEMENPSTTVLTDLDQLLGLVDEDIAELTERRGQVLLAQAIVNRRLAS